MNVAVPEKLWIQVVIQLFSNIKCKIQIKSLLWVSVFNCECCFVENYVCDLKKKRIVENMQHTIGAEKFFA